MKTERFKSGPAQPLVLMLVPLALLAALLACNLNVNVPGNPKPPVPSLVPSAADADAFEQSFRDAVSQASSTRKFSVSVTQQQFSSWLNLRAPTYAQQQGYEWPLKSVQAGLDNSKITLYGVITKANVPDTPAQVVFTPSIDANGELAVNVDSGQVGIVGVPADMLKNLNQTIQSTLTNQLGQIKGRYRLTNLTVSGGTLTVGGDIVG